MRSLTTVSVMLCTTFVGVHDLSGQDSTQVVYPEKSLRISVEVDPTTFLFNGYSFHLRYQPVIAGKFVIGLGTYALDLPDFYVDMNKVNRDAGWAVRIRSAHFITGEFFRKKANQGWFIGEQVGFQSYKVSLAREARGSARFNNLLLMTYVGYSWHPYKGSFYIKPWVGVGFSEKVDGINKIGTTRYDVSPFFPFFTFHAGYTF